MRFSEVLTASTLAVPLVVAHGGIPGAPRIFGVGAGVKARDFMGPAARRATLPPKGHMFNKRQGGVDGQCGPNAGDASCDAGYCCSSAGWCGNTQDYCQAPDCLIDYGPGCDANSVPNGDDTRTIARPQLGDVAYGGLGIYSCSEPGTIAITYDDGPYIYTNDVLDQFAAKNMKATFFITGKNNGKGAIDDASTPWPAVISRMIAEGHQVASHTWSHQDLSLITQEQRINQMVHNEMALRNIIQKFPTYMRPPYSSCNDACQSDLTNLGYVVTYFDLDTDDYDNTTPDKIQNAKDNFSNKLSPSDPTSSDWLAIGHDIHQQTALNLTGYMLDLVVSKGFRGVTVGECLGDPEANWYRASSGKIVTSSSAVPSATTSSTSSAPAISPTTVSADGSCGGTTGYTCIGFADGTCCSQFGWCGSSTDHCGTGCNPLYGNCGSSASSSVSVTSAASGTTSSSASSATPSGLVTSTDGSCGGSSGFTCAGFADGECCSQYNWCGASTEHCGNGCNPLYGNCASSSVSSLLTASSSSSSVTITSSSTLSAATITSSTTSTTSPASTVNVSTNGRCGSRNKGTTCAGYKNRFGQLNECCSMAGTCGNGFLGCAWGCQKKYGKCMF